MKQFFVDGGAGMAWYRAGLAERVPLLRTHIVVRFLASRPKWLFARQRATGDRRLVAGEVKGRRRLYSALRLASQRLVLSSKLVIRVKMPQISLFKLRLLVLCPCRR